MAVLPVIIHPDGVLRQKAEAVTNITPEILQLLDGGIKELVIRVGHQEHRSAARSKRTQILGCTPRYLGGYKSFWERRFLKN